MTRHPVLAFIPALFLATALMGTAHGKYTFTSHLKWSWAMVLGYAAALYVHYLLNDPR